MHSILLPPSDRDRSSPLTFLGSVKLELDTQAGLLVADDGQEVKCSPLAIDLLNILRRAVVFGQGAQCFVPYGELPAMDPFGQPSTLLRRATEEVAAALSRLTRMSFTVRVACSVVSISWSHR